MHHPSILLPTNSALSPKPRKLEKKPSSPFLFSPALNFGPISRSLSPLPPPPPLSPPILRPTAHLFLPFSHYGPRSQPFFKNLLASPPITKEIDGWKERGRMEGGKEEGAAELLKNFWQPPFPPSFLFLAPSMIACLPAKARKEKTSVSGWIPPFSPSQPFFPSPVLITL